MSIYDEYAMYAEELQEEDIGSVVEQYMYDYVFDYE